MSGMSDFLENALLDHVLGGDAYTQPASVHLALFSAAPNDAGGGTELSGNGYAREEVSFAAAHATNGTAANDTAVEFAADGADWDEVTHIGLFDAATDGNLLFHGAITTPRTVTDQGTLTFAIGDIVVTLD